MPWQIKCDKLLACPALLSFYRTKSVSQTWPYPVSFPVQFFFFHHTRNNVELGRKIGKKKRGGNAKRVEGKEKKERVSLSRWFFVSVARDNILWANERKSGLVNFQREGEHDPKTWNACAISDFSFWLMAGVNGLKREGGRQQFLSLSNQRPPMSKWHTASPYSRT